MGEDRYFSFVNHLTNVYNRHEMFGVPLRQGPA